MGIENDVEKLLKRGEHKKAEKKIKSYFEDRHKDMQDLDGLKRRLYTEESFFYIDQLEKMYLEYTKKAVFLSPEHSVDDIIETSETLLAYGKTMETLWHYSHIFRADRSAHLEETLKRLEQKIRYQKILRLFKPETVN